MQKGTVGRLSAEQLGLSEKKKKNLHNRNHLKHALPLPLLAFSPFCLHRVLGVRVTFLSLQVLF